MRFYIASTLENAEMVRWFAGKLKSWGWQQTYDWTVHGPVQGPLLAETAEKELSGVIDADAVFIACRLTLVTLVVRYRRHNKRLFGII